MPLDWSSGYYSLVLRGEGAHRQVRGEISFVVRAAWPGRGSGILLQRTTNTDAAYNSWGGYTLYSGPDGPAHRVSFDRPYAGFAEDGIYLFTLEGRFEKDLDERRISEPLQAAFRGVGIELSPHSFVQVTHPGRRWYLVVPGITYTLKSEGRQLRVYDGFTTWESGWRNWEQFLVAWAERSGYSLEYAVNTDLEFCPEILRHYRLVLSVGHDEYWSAPMRDHLEEFVAGGGNLAFFSGNNLWWQVRSEDRGRALVCWKDFKRDPYYGSGRYDRLTTLWCHHLVQRPENRLTGVSFARGATMTSLTSTATVRGTTPSIGPTTGFSRAPGCATAILWEESTGWWAMSATAAISAGTTAGRFQPAVKGLRRISPSWPRPRPPSLTRTSRFAWPRRPSMAKGHPGKSLSRGRPSWASTVGEGPCLPPDVPNGPKA